MSIAQTWILEALDRVASRFQRSGLLLLESVAAGAAHGISSRFFRQELRAQKEEFEAFLAEQRSKLDKANDEYKNDVRQSAKDITGNLTELAGTSHDSSNPPLARTYHKMLVTLDTARTGENLPDPSEIAADVKAALAQADAGEVQAWASGLDLEKTADLVRDSIRELRRRRADRITEIGTAVGARQTDIEGKLDQVSEFIEQVGSVDPGAYASPASSPDVSPDLPPRLRNFLDVYRSLSSSAVRTTFQAAWHDARRGMMLTPVDPAGLADIGPTQTEIFDQARAGVGEALDQARRKYKEVFCPAYAQAIAERREAERQIWSIETRDGVPFAKLERTDVKRRIERDLITGRYVMTMRADGTRWVRLAESGEESPTAPFAAWARQRFWSAESSSGTGRDR